MKKQCGIIVALYAVGNPVFVYAQKTLGERPNFVWFMAEDVSKHYLSLYNDGKYGADTPNVDKLAGEGIVFENAYCNAPVSSAARSTLITGCYAPRLGISFHRKLEQVPMPEELNMFPAYLRKAGYYTSNAAKTDYNCFLDKEAWDVVNGKMGDWRNRPDKNMPFLHVRTNAVTHEGKLHFKENAMLEIPTRNKQSDVFIHPNHPNTKLFRYTYATFYDRIQDSDKELGELMNMLEADGELDNTFIFYFGDNGGSLPGSKGYTTETGLNVPLVIYVPKKWRNKLSLKIGTRTNGFVSFMDFGPTLLHLAGISVPKEMDGIPFLGEDISLQKLEARDEVYGYGDRFDELYAFNRTLRKGNFKYSRNFQSYHPKSLYAYYRYRQAAFREWNDLYKSGDLNDVQKHFFEAQGAEELYDLSVDPYETHNLANHPKYLSKLKELRGLLKENMLKKHDLGYLLECEWLEHGRQNPVGFGIENAASIRKYSDIADLELYPFTQVRDAIRNALLSSDPVERYWGSTVCASFARKASSLSRDLKKLLNDSQAYVRSRAVVALCRMGEVKPEEKMREALKLAHTDAETLLVMNDIAYLQESGLGHNFNLNSRDIPHLCDGVERRLEYLK